MIFIKYNIYPDTTNNFISPYVTEEIIVVQEEEKIIAFDFNHLERILLNVLSNAIKYACTTCKITVKIWIEDE